MNASQWVDLVLALCRLVFFYLENRKARRDNDGL
jgi:hypothetical protein